MATTETTCRIRLYDGTQLVDLTDHPNTTDSLRQQWAASILNHFQTPAYEPQTHLRAWDLLAHPDGSVHRLPAPQPAPLPNAVSATPHHLESVYPIHYRLPLSTLPSTPLTAEELVVRAEIFALRSLLYEVLVGRKPFADLPDDEVQRRFAAGDFPADADEGALDSRIVLPSGPSGEGEGSFSQAMVVKQDGTFPRLVDHDSQSTNRLHPPTESQCNILPLHPRSPIAQNSPPHPPPPSKAPAPTPARTPSSSACKPPASS